MFVVSDFISEPGWEAPLARLAQRHDVVAVRLFDPLEMTLPELGMVLMQDAETGEQIFVDTGAARLSRALRRRRPNGARPSCATPLARAGVDTLELSTDGDLGDSILSFVDARRQRSRLAARAPCPATPARRHAMNFLWQEALWLLLLLPLLVFAYVWLLKRRKKTRRRAGRAWPSSRRRWATSGCGGATCRRRCCCWRWRR